MAKARTIDPVFLDAPVPIRTPRLVLRPANVGDGAAIADAVGESFDALHPWFHAAMRERAIEGSAKWQEAVACRFLAQFVARERLAFYAWEGARLCGFVELDPDWRVGRMSLSYWVRSSMTGQGLGTEAAGAAVRYAFEALDARLVTVSHAEGNTASARLIAKLGFERSARRSLCYEMPDGTLMDEIGYSATGADGLPIQSVAWGSNKRGSR